MLRPHKGRTLFAEELSRRLGIKTMEDWYRVRTRDIINAGGESLLSKSNHSLYLALKSIYPSFDWQGWRFSESPSGFWDSRSNRYAFLEWAAKQLGIVHIEDWYNIRWKDFIEIGGSGLLSRFGGSMSALLADSFPDYKWFAWKFHQVPQGYWKDPNNKIKYMDWLGNQLGIKEMEDWYKIKWKEAVEKGGKTLLNVHYNGSLIQALISIYPNYNWKPWLFSQVPKGFWEDSINANQFVTWLTERLKINHLEDWNRVSVSQISKMAPLTFIDKQGGLKQMLKNLYPHHIWNESKRNPRASQRMLKIAVESLFPNSLIYEDYLHSKLFFESGHGMQLDIFLPEISLAFEYQGEHHFFDIHIFGPQEEYSFRDEQKRLACKKNGITLIEVPFWWDFKIESLKATISLYRPDLFPKSNQGIPIPMNPPNQVLPKGNEISSKFALAKDWNKVSDLTGWWLSEKLDGVRAYWDGQHMYSRSGKELQIPTFFLKDLPKEISLDGELWAGKGTIEKLVATLSSKDNSNWKNIQYCVFDIPSSLEPYELRMEQLNKLKLPSHVQVIRSQRCQSQEHLIELLNHVSSHGGEGLMAVQPGSYYIPNRTPHLLKQLEDLEVRMVAVDDRNGQLVCQEPNGRLFLVRCHIQILNNPPKVGSIITIKHSGHWNNGSIKYPTFWRERPDMEWKSHFEFPTQNGPLDLSRVQFDWIGKNLNIQKPEDWYHIHKEEVVKQGGKRLIHHHRNSLTSTLTSIYPEHDWHLWRFSQVPKGYWKSDNNATNFINWLSKELKITKLEDWYRVSLDQIEELAPITLIRNHGGLIRLLTKLYPHHPWDTTKVNRFPRASQRTLKLIVEELFPTTAVHEDFIHPNLTYESGHNLQFDIFLPSYNLAFDYQGQQHYYDVFIFSMQQEYSFRDQQKRRICKDNQITLIEVPYWWDRSKDSLKSTIHLERPDLIPDSTGPPIPESEKNQSSKASFSLTLAQNWDWQQDLTGWWLSEKMDGVRAYWDGKRIYSKQGKELTSVPHWFLEGLPDMPLEGELWAGEGGYEEVVGLINSKNDHPLWKKIKFMIFDVPMSKEKLEKRMDILQEIKLPKQAQIVIGQRCKGRWHLEEMLNSIESKGGEGIMARLPNSNYEYGRSSTLLKVKRVHDAEVRFVDVDEDNRHLVCERNGQVCLVRCHQQIRENPPKQDSIITVKHFGVYSNGTLKNPFFWRERKDFL